MYQLSRLNINSLVPNVVMNGFIRIFATIKPFMTPKNDPTANPNIMESQIGFPCLNEAATKLADKAPVTPNERSTPPVAITRVSPATNRKIGIDCPNIFSKLRIVKKAGLAIAIAINKTRNTIKRDDLNTILLNAILLGIVSVVDTLLTLLT
jgi:hypothetical protein